MSSFWNKITKPIFVQAPLANVTDVAFREIIAKYGRPDVFFTEFVSADGLCSKGREVLLRDLRYTENQRPIVAQFFGANPEHIKKCAELAVELGFDGVDINMGCPDKAVLKQGAGAALIKNPKLAAEIIEAAMEGARSASSGQAGIPVSVKTRIGYNKIEIEEWVPMLLKTGIVALVLHLRTMKEMSKVPAHWEVLKRVVEIRDELKSDAFVIGNGDVMSLAEGRRRAEETGADGVMFGRAMFGNPWLFAGKESYRLDASEPALVAEHSARAKLEALLELMRLHHQMWGTLKNFDDLKKHFKAYVTGFDNASELRNKLMLVKSATEAEGVIAENISLAD